ncbi:MAG: hypothetical protein FD138_4140 [Planctomycetota bacterium]|nr:MAG: hypothetical protein FD138_4140 [Planctomycetota bacterium]
MGPAIAPAHQFSKFWWAGAALVPPYVLLNTTNWTAVQIGVVVLRSASGLETLSPPFSLFWNSAMRESSARMLLLAVVAAILIAGPPSLHVMAVLSKAGCNLGTCHGNQNGKGGFKLSLRGENPDADFVTLTHEQVGRRVNTVRAENSLLLLKPTMSVPHEGSKRFDEDSPEYDLLRRWIAAGMPATPRDEPKLQSLEVTPLEQFVVEPDESVQLQAIAKFADGSTRDVIRLACFETSQPTVNISVNGLVRRERFGEVTVTVRYLDQQVAVRLAFLPTRPGFVANVPPAANFIDEQVFSKLTRLRMNASDVCDDATFVRRASLDLLGVVPSATEAREFVRDQRLDKRQRLIDDLLTRPEFADYWEDARSQRGRDVSRLDPGQHRDQQAARCFRPRADRRAWQHLRASPRQLLPRDARPDHAGRDRRSSLSRHAAAMREVSQSPVRSLDADRLLRLGESVLKGEVRGVGEQPPRQK